MDINIACLEYYLWNSSVSLVSTTKSKESKELYFPLFSRILVIITQLEFPLLLIVTASAKYFSLFYYVPRGSN